MACRARNCVYSSWEVGVQRILRRLRRRVNARLFRRPTPAPLASRLPEYLLPRIYTPFPPRECDSRSPASEVARVARYAPDRLAERWQIPATPRGGKRTAPHE